MTSEAPAVSGLLYSNAQCEVVYHLPRGWDVICAITLSALSPRPPPPLLPPFSVYLQDKPLLVGEVTAASGAAQLPGDGPLVSHPRRQQGSGGGSRPREASPGCCHTAKVAADLPAVAQGPDDQKKHDHFRLGGAAHLAGGE